MSDDLYQNPVGQRPTVRMFHPELLAWSQYPSGAEEIAAESGWMTEVEVEGAGGAEKITENKLAAEAAEAKQQQKSEPLAAENKEH